jgi:hypothetical protein
VAAGRAPPGPRLAPAAATIAGVVEEVIIATSGTGYTSAPTLTFVGGGLANGSLNHATATATITNSIKTVNVTTLGIHYFILLYIIPKKRTKMMN